MAKSKKQQYLEAVWKLQNKCAKEGIVWKDFIKQFNAINGNPSPNAATPPPKPPIDPLP